jgi:hypothetical protein
MTAEQLVRDQLDRATHEVVGGPDLTTSIRNGRRRRRTTRVGVAAAAVAVLGLGAVGAHALGGGDRGAVAHDVPVADGPAPAPPLPAAPVDFVPGTDVDDTMAATIAERLPALPAPDDVYPSDSNTAGPIPDSEFARAQDWQAAYTTDTGGALVMMGLPEELGGWRCSDCNAHDVPGGTLYHQAYSTDDDGGTWWFGTYFVADDGHFVNAFESVQAPDEQTATGQRQLSDHDIEALVEDPRLSFTRP